MSSSGSIPEMRVRWTCCRVTSLGLAVPVEHLDLVGHLGRLDAEQVAGVGVLGHQAQRLALAAAADQDPGRPSLSGGGRTASRPAGSACPRRAVVLAPHLAADLQRFLQPLEALASATGTGPRGPCARVRTMPRRYPSKARPPLSTSSVVTVLTSRPGCRYVTPVTSGPSATVVSRRGSRARCTPRASAPRRPAELLHLEEWSIIVSVVTPQLVGTLRPPRRGSVPGRPGLRARSGSRSGRPAS